VLKFGVDSRSVSAVVSTLGRPDRVTQGELRREWREGNRRYFEYEAERPIWPAVSFASAGYEVARDTWNDVALEIYHDKEHGTNIEALLKTVKVSLDYLTREFAPTRTLPSRSSNIQVLRRRPLLNRRLSRSARFITDNSRANGLDFATIHELSYQWWGGIWREDAAGRCHELAQYSTLMIFKKYFGGGFAGQVARSFQDSYLKARRAETDAERPLIETDDQEYISYGKGPLAFYALQDAIGEDRVNLALRNYLHKFAFKAAPFPTSRDVVNELRAVAGEVNQELITDLFERIILYDFQVDQVDVRPSGDVFEVSITLTAHKFEADGLGEETEVPLDVDVDIALFAQSDSGGMSRLPVHQVKRRVSTGIQTIAVQVADRPAAVEIDPFYKLIDRTRQNNSMKIDR
jgi:aminopeptidase N